MHPNVIQLINVFLYVCFNINRAGGEDDFEMFLESVKARSQTVRANGELSNQLKCNN